MDPTDSDLQHAVEHILSLTAGDRGVLEIVRVGRRAIPLLRARLFQREVSGLFYARCRVVEALSALGAVEILTEFLNTDRYIPDPVERAGEDAVINAVARALGRSTEETVFRRLLFLADIRKLIGPIEVIGAKGRPEVIPCLVACLEDDLARPVAEEGLRNFGTTAAPALIQAASPATTQVSESESVLRRRRSALRLLSEIAPLAAVPRSLRDEWRSDPDRTIALLGCQLSLARGDPAERDAAVQELVGMLGEVGWSARREIEELLCHTEGGEALYHALARAVPVDPEDRSPAADRHRSLMRIKDRLHGKHK